MSAEARGGAKSQACQQVMTGATPRRRRSSRGTVAARASEASEQRCRASWRCHPGPNRSPSPAPSRPPAAGDRTARTRPTSAFGASLARCRPCPAARLAAQAGRAPWAAADAHGGHHLGKADLITQAEGDLGSIVVQLPQQASGHARERPLRGGGGRLRPGWRGGSWAGASAGSTPRPHAPSRRSAPTAAGSRSRMLLHRQRGCSAACALVLAGWVGRTGPWDARWPPQHLIRPRRCRVRHSAC